MSARGLILAATLMAVAAGCGWLWWGPAAGPTHVVLVVACTLRKDQTSPYGAPAHVTPFMSSLAQQGVRFLDAIDAAPWTKAASTALLTGHHAITVGMVEPSTRPNRRRLAPEVTTLAEHLHGAGYATYGATTNPNLNAIFGFDQGFEHYQEMEELWGKVGVVKVPMGRVVDRLLEVVDATRDERPLFLQLMVIDAHDPIHVSPEERSAMSAPDLPENVAAYRAAVHQLDQGLAYLDSELRARGLTQENTLFILVNDHGEGLRWPRGQGKGHGNLLVPSVVQMPWLMRGPGVAAGHEVGGVASQVDLLPTLLGLLGLPSPEGPGMDWSEQVRGRLARTTRSRAFVDTWFQTANRSAVYTETLACHHDHGKHKRAVDRLFPKTACYDRQRDPQQLTPLPSLDLELLRALRDWRQAARAEFKAWPYTQNATPPESIKAQLEALGYAADTGVDPP